MQIVRRHFTDEPERIRKIREGKPHIGSLFISQRTLDCPAQSHIAQRLLRRDPAAQTFAPDRELLARFLQMKKDIAMRLHSLGGTFRFTQ